MKGTTKIGWFKSDGSKLHGYGSDLFNKEKGFFEDGSFKSSSDLVSQYDIEFDLISQPVTFESYIVKT